MDASARHKILEALFMTFVLLLCVNSQQGDVWFSLKGTTYQNNSNIILENIGEGDNALLCVTNYTACCRPPYTDEIGSKALGNWFFPNGTRVTSSDNQWGFFRTRSHMVVHLNRRGGGVEGIYRCVIPDTRNVTQTLYIGVYSANTGAGDVWFSFKGTTYQNNSIVTLEDIGEGDDALLCVTNYTACCRPPYTDEMGPQALGNWFFPDGTRVTSSNNQWGFFRIRGHMVVRLNHRGGGVEGIYSCQIPDTMNVAQTLYIGVYSSRTGSPSVTGLTYHDQSRTLTCTSTGGPANNVTWRRDGVVITLNATYQQTKTLVDPVNGTYQQTKRVVDSVTGTYQTVLTIDPSLDQRSIEGTYSCTVENDRGESSETVVVPGDVWFSLRGTTYQNNSNIILEDIGEGDDALLCITDLTTCCRQENASAFGNWFFPNGTKVFSADFHSDIYRTRGQMVVRLNRKRGGAEGIYRCMIPDTFGFTQNIYIGVYSANTAVVSRGIPYRNNSIVILENIGEGDDGLLCITHLTACCRPPYTGVNRSTLGNWYLPNGTRVPSSGNQWDFYITRGQMVVRMHRRRGGAEGIYRCEINDAKNVIQTIYIGVYSASTAIVFRGIPYRNNSIVFLEDIGEGRDDALLCITNQTACCRSPYTGNMGPVLGDWFFPNGTVVFSTGVHSDIYRTRGQMVVRLHRRRGGENGEGIYRCEIPDAMNVTQTIYSGVYSESTNVVLRGIPYKNNSILNLEDIIEGDDALLCITNQTACCRPPYTGINGSVIGNWFFPNGTRVSSSDSQWDFYRSRDQMVVLLHRRKGGEEGIYRCEIPDTMNVIQTIYIGLYSASTATTTVSSSSIQPTNTPQSTTISRRQPTDTPQSDEATTLPVVIIVAAVVTTLVIFTAAVIILFVLIRRKGIKKNKSDELKLQNTGTQATTSADQPLYAVAHVHKGGAPSEPEELNEYLDQNNTHEYKVPVKQTPAASEYTLPVKSLKLFTLSEPMFGEMESNPTYQSVDQCHVSSRYANLPQEVTSDGIYSVPQ